MGARYFASERELEEYPLARMTREDRRKLRCLQLPHHLVIIFTP